MHKKPTSSTNLYKKPKKKKCIHTNIRPKTNQPFETLSLKNIYKTMYLVTGRTKFQYLNNLYHYNLYILSGFELTIVIVHILFN